MEAELGEALKYMYALPPTGSSGVNEHFAAVTQTCSGRTAQWSWNAGQGQMLVCSTNACARLSRRCASSYQRPIKLAQVRVLWIRTGGQARWRSMTKLGRHAKPEHARGVHPLRVPRDSAQSESDGITLTSQPRKLGALPCAAVCCE